jgi:hypothetical protein
VEREELHFRRIDIRGWRRSDGLFEVEGSIVDRKPHPMTLETPNGPRVLPANEPLHEMGVKLVFDEDMLVHDATAFTTSAPYDECFAAGSPLQALKGMHISAGWSRELQRRLGGVLSCTHLLGILNPVAAAAFQSLTMLRLDRPVALADDGRPAKVDSCYAYAADRSVVLHRWPAFYTGKRAAAEDK